MNAECLQQDPARSPDRLGLLPCETYGDGLAADLAGRLFAHHAFEFEAEIGRLRGRDRVTCVEEEKRPATAAKPKFLAAVDKKCPSISNFRAPDMP